MWLPLGFFFFSNFLPLPYPRTFSFPLHSAFCIQTFLKILYLETDQPIEQGNPHKSSRLNSHPSFIISFLDIFAFVSSPSSLPCSPLSSYLRAESPISGKLLVCQINWMAIPLCVLTAFMAFIDPVHSLELSSLVVSIMLPLFLLLQPKSQFDLSIFSLFPLPQDPIYSCFSHHALAPANLTLTNLPVLLNLPPNSLRILSPYFQLSCSHVYHKHDIRRAELITFPPVQRLSASS